METGLFEYYEEKLNSWEDYKRSVFSLLKTDFGWDGSCPPSVDLDEFRKKGFDKKLNPLHCANDFVTLLGKVNSTK